MNLLLFSTIICYSGFFIATGVLGLGLLITIHELGHFFFCKLFKVRTPSFSIGFGPRVFSKKIGDTDFALSLIPLGGYVEIAGSAEMGQGSQQEAFARDESSFAVKPYYQKLLIMLGGIFFNMLFAYIACSFLFMVGIQNPPALWPPQTALVGRVAEGSTAEQSGIKAGDRIITAIFDDGTIVTDDALELAAASRIRSGHQVSLIIERDNQPLTLQATIGQTVRDNKTIGALGIEFARPSVPAHNPFTAIKKGINLVHYYTIKLVDALISKFRHREIGEVTGPLGLISIVAEESSAGYAAFLLLLTFISINLAVFNLIPIPILDGGQIVIHSIEALFKRELPLRIKEIIGLTSWVLMGALLLYATYYDLWHLFGPYFSKITTFFTRA